MVLAVARTPLGVEQLVMLKAPATASAAITVEKRFIGRVGEWLSEVWGILSPVIEYVTPGLGNCRDKSKAFTQTAKYFYVSWHEFCFS